MKFEKFWDKKKKVRDQEPITLFVLLLIFASLSWWILISETAPYDSTFPSWLQKIYHYFFKTFGVLFGVFSLALNRALSDKILDFQHKDKIR